MDSRDLNMLLDSLVISGVIVFGLVCVTYIGLKFKELFGK